jgi:hypothetical protein
MGQSSPTSLKGKSAVADRSSYLPASNHRFSVEISDKLAWG